MSENTFPIQDHPSFEVAADLTSGPAPEATAGSVSPRRLSRLLVVALVLAVGLLIGSAVLAQRADGQRRSAEARQATAASGVEAQQSRSDASDLDYSASQETASTFERDLALPLATAQQATQMNDQGSINAQKWLEAGLSGSDYDYNAAVDEGNRLTDQVDGVIDQLNDQLAQLPTP